MRLLSAIYRAIVDATETMTNAGKLIIVAGVALVGGSPFVMDYIAKWESSGNTVLTVYADKLAGGIPTVCDGITKHVTSTPIVVGDKWTVEKCLEETQRAVINVQTKIAKCFKLPPNQMVFDIATSHAWNFGAGATCGSLAMKAWNQGQWELGCKRLALNDSGTPAWSYTCKTVKGVRECHFVKGLQNRRQDEWKHCAGSLK